MVLEVIEKLQKKASLLASIWSGPANYTCIDLIGDYCGQNLFAVDADSVLEYLLRQESLYSISYESYGPHPLHILYRFEQFLSKLHSAGANFALVWFEGRKHLCAAPAYCDERLSNTQRRFHVAARVHLRTLVKIHAAANCEVKQQYTFQSLSSPSWADFVVSSKPFFILSHDGNYDDENVATTRESSSRYVNNSLLTMAQTVAIQQHLSGDGGKLCSPLSVAFIKDNMFVDNKVIAFLLETRPRIRPEGALKLVHEISGYVSRIFSTMEDTLLLYPLSTPVTHTMTNDSQLTVGEHIASVVVENLLKSNDPSTMALARAVLLHAVLIPRLEMHQRCFKRDVLVDSPLRNQTLRDLYIVSNNVLCGYFDRAPKSDALAAMVDPALLLSLACNTELQQSCIENLPIEWMNVYQNLCSQVSIKTSYIDYPISKPIATDQNTHQVTPVDRGLLLPYEHHVFSQFIPPLPVTEDKKFELRGNVEFGSIFFRDLSHWHRVSPISIAQNRIVANRLTKDVNKYRRGKARISDQGQAKWLMEYASSLTGANGRTLEKATITVDKDSTRKGGKQSKGHKTEPKLKKPNQKKLSKKEQIIAANEKAKCKQNDSKSKDLWSRFLDDLGIEQPLSTFEGLELGSLPEMIKNRRDQLDILKSRRFDDGSTFSDCNLSLLRIRLAIECWILSYKEGKKDIAFAVEVFNQASATIARLTQGNLDSFREYKIPALYFCWISLKVLGLHSAHARSLEEIQIELENLLDSDQQCERLLRRTLPFCAPRLTRSTKFEIPLSATRFQLLHCGDHMERQLDSLPDPRVSFVPDGWQRIVLDKIDGRESILVVAPTSAGKTFSSFYAIENVLRESDDGVVVYVAPTKALVNQIAAEIVGRFSKSYKHSGQSLFSVLTRDFRINNPLKCQVLITVPEMLEIMLLQSDVVSKWVPKLQRVIFDEVHTVAEINRGNVYDRIILIAHWLESISDAHGHKFSVVRHNYRYSDLVKYVYCPEYPFRSFNGLSDEYTAPTGLRHLHPFSALCHGNAEIVDDLELTPREMVEVYDRMAAVASPDEGWTCTNLDIETFFDRDRPIKRADTIRYQTSLRQVLRTWMDKPGARLSGTPFQKLMKALDGGIEDCISQLDQKLPCTIEDPSFWMRAIVPLLREMNSSDLLPGLFFNYDRKMVEDFVRVVLDELVTAEDAFKKSDPCWISKVKEKESWMNEKEKGEKEFKKAASKMKGKMKEQLEREQMASATGTWHSSFNPDDPLPQFSFGNQKCSITQTERLAEIESIRKDTPEFLIKALERGIAAHHAGLPRKYLQVVERWFRSRWIRVCFCTGSFALGINMPAVSSVFCGSSVYLTALQYRQASGRAGRRGMDLRGNVIFLGLPVDKIRRLLTSKVPDIKVSFPLRTTLVLRLHVLLSSMEQSNTSKKMVAGLFHLDRMCLSDDKAMPAMHHHLRASVEYLRRFGLLDAEGSPIDLAGLVCHIFYAEPSNLAFASILRSGYLYELANLPDLKDAGRKLVLILCHLFRRRPILRKLDQEAIKRSPSKVHLEPLPDEVRIIIQKHSRLATDTYEDYALAYANSGCSLPHDDHLPLSRLCIPTETAEFDQFGRVLEPHLISAATRSKFWSLLGLGDRYNSVTEMTESLRPGLALCNEAIPAFDLFVSDEPLNAYILDFYKHGIVKELVDTNGIRRGDVWHLVNDFHLILASLRTSIEILIRYQAFTIAAGTQPLKRKPNDVYDEIFGSDDEVEADDADEDGTEDDDEVMNAGVIIHFKGKRTREIPPLIRVEAKLRDPELWKFYKLLHQVQVEFAEKFYAIFA
ncbi:hypothetical protein BKA69DRAFT_1128834 [Paraphysoderma sedebokerense]|nr:hypothetical protein BKA69DRAFT_1128834 [Paraphysoderma sedebokerense]